MDEKKTEENTWKKTEENPGIQPEWIHPMQIAHMWPPNNFLGPAWVPAEGFAYPHYYNQYGYLPTQIWHERSQDSSPSKDIKENKRMAKTNLDFPDNYGGEFLEHYSDLNTPASLLNFSNISFSGMWPEALNDSLHSEGDSKEKKIEPKTPTKPYKGKRRGRKPKNKSANPEQENHGGECTVTKPAYSDIITELTLKVFKMLKMPRRDTHPREWNTNFPFPRGSLPNKKSNYYKYVHSYNELPEYSESLFDDVDDVDSDDCETIFKPLVEVQEGEKSVKACVETSSKFRPLDLSEEDRLKYKNDSSKIQRKALKRRKIKGRLQRKYPYSNRRHFKPSMTTTIRCRNGGNCPNKMQMYQKHVFGDHFMKKMREERMTEKLIKVLCSTPQRTLRNNCKKPEDNIDSANTSFSSQENSSFIISEIGEESGATKTHQLNELPDGYFLVEGGVCPDIDPTIWLA